MKQRTFLFFIFFFPFTFSFGADEQSKANYFSATGSTNSIDFIAQAGPTGFAKIAGLSEEMVPFYGNGQTGVLSQLLITTGASCNANHAKVYDPVLAVVLMVKNEEHVIVQTLEPCIKDGIKDFFVFDTGSFDKTIEKAQELFKQYGLSRAYIAQEPFIDFEKSRNRALELAKEKFPKAAFFLMPDAEWYLHNGEKLLEFCQKHAYDKGEKPSSYLIRLVNNRIDFYHSRLIRATLDSKFVGAVHEVIVPATGVRVPTDIYLELGSTKLGYEKSKQRWIRDCAILAKKHQENPNDSRTTFYLAQTYECLQDWVQAYKHYLHRSTLKGWPEEDFMTLYRMGRAVEELVRQKKEGFLWDYALKIYLDAFVMRPNRIEPLIKIAKHYLDEDNMQLCFIFAMRAAQVPYPTNDILFVEKEMYDFTRYDILGRCAWYVGQYDIGEAAMKKAIEARPNTPYLERNMAFYEGRKAGANQAIYDKIISDA